MSTRPTIALARWADQIGANLVSPTSGERDLGFQAGTPASAGKVNWQINQFYLWALWLSDGDVAFHNLSATGTFGATGAATLASTLAVAGTLTCTVGAVIGGAITIGGNATVGGGVTVGGQTLAFADFTFTADSTTDQLTATGHSLQTGDGPIRVSSTLTLPSNLSTGIDYWIIRIDADHLQLAASRDCALEALPIDLQTNGTGILTLSTGVSGVTRISDATVSRSLTVGGPTTLHDTSVGGETFTYPSTVFTASSVFNTLSINNHPFRTGDGPLRVTNSGGALPGGLLAGTDYYAIRDSNFNFRLATSRVNALQNFSIDLTTNGTGTNSVTTGTNATHPSIITVAGTVSADLVKRTGIRTIQIPLLTSTTGASVTVQTVTINSTTQWYRQIPDLVVGQTIIAVRLRLLDNTSGPTKAQALLQPAADGALGATLGSPSTSDGSGTAQYATISAVNTQVAAGTMYIASGHVTTGSANVTLYHLEVDVID